MKLPTARPYQTKALHLMRKAYHHKKRKILLFLATGGGKSVLFLLITINLLKNKKKVLFVVKRRELVFQAQKHFLRSEIPTSIMIGSSAGFDPNCTLQICSVDTIIRRDTDFLKGFDFVIIDEAHDCTSKSYQSFLKKCETELLINQFIGFTATPFSVGKKSHSFWDACVKPVEMHELRDEKFLVPVDLYVPDPINLDDVQVDSKTGDFMQKELSAKMSKLEIIGDVIEDYNRLGQKSQAICFCVDVEHSMAMTKEFNSAGIPAIHCDAETPQKERDEVMKRFKNKEIQVICNVNIFSTGVDIPQAVVGIMARPTRSEILYIQQAGRLLRPCRICGKCKTQYDNSDNCPVCNYDSPSYIKERAILIDSGNNTSRFGQVYDIRYPSMDDESVKKNKSRVMALIKTCSACFKVYDAKERFCPGCGDTGTRERFLETKAGELRPYDEYEMIKTAFTQLQRIALEQARKPNWKFFQLYERYGDIVMKYKAEFQIPAFIPNIYKKSQEEKLSGKYYTN